MFILDSTTKTLEVVLAGAITTSQLPFTTSYVDVATSTQAVTPGAQDGATNSTTAVTIMAAPASGSERRLVGLTITNIDTVAATVTVRLNDNSTIRKQFTFTLSVGDNIVISQQDVQVFDSSGNFKTIQTTTVPANQTYREIAFALDGGGGAAISVVSGNNTWYLSEVPYAGTITGWSLIADQVGSVDIDIWKSNAAVPTVSNSITASAQCSLAASQSVFNGPITGWTSAVSRGDCVAFNLSSASVVSKISLTVQITAS